MKELNDIFLCNFEPFKCIFTFIKKHLKLFIFFMIIILNVNVFAQDFNVSSTITAPTCNTSSTCSGGHYTGLENYNVGANSVYTINTRYNGRLGAIRFNIPLPNNWPDSSTCFSTGDLTYRLTLNMATQDWRNYFARPFISNTSTGTNFATSSVVFVSQYKIYFNFKIPSGTCTDYLYVYLQSPNQTSTSFTGVTNWNLSSIVLTANFPSSGGGGGSGTNPTPTPSGATNQDIINNQTNNTNNIINNQNNNTNSIIDNQSENTNNIIENNNQNTQQIIDSNNSNFNDCFQSFTTSKLMKGKTYTTMGQLSSNSNSYYSKVYKIEPGSVITIANSSGNVVGNWYILWDDNMNFIDYYYMRNRVSASPSNARYFAYSTTDTNIQVSIDTGFCTSKLDNIGSSIDDLNNTISNPNIDNGTGSDFFSGFSDNQHGLTSIITAPLTAIQSITSSTCQPLSLPIPFTNSNVSLPCMTEVYQQRIPSIYNIWKVVSFGIIAYFICIDIFHIVKGFKDPESDKVEVMDL